MTLKVYHKEIFEHTVALLEALGQDSLLSRNIIRALAKELQRVADTENIKSANYEKILSEYRDFTNEICLPQNKFYG